MKRIAYGVVGLIAMASQSAYASSLPQMDSTWFANQLFWLAVSFAVLYACVSLVIAPAIKGVLDTRETAISTAIREAELAKHTAESTRSDATSSSQNARMKAAEMMAKAQTENNAEAAQAIAKLDHELNRRASQAAAVIEDAVKKANTGMDDAVKSLAREMTAKLLSPVSIDASEPKLKLAKR
jgi:F-type H+-transporting ATPase subunit b